MEIETDSQLIGRTKRKQKKSKTRVERKLSIKHTVFLFWILVLCLLLGFLVNNPVIRSKASSLYRAPHPAVNGAIPGLTYKNLSKYLRSINITCQPAIQTETGFAGVCAEISPQGIVDIQIQVFGKTSDEIDTLQMDMVQYLRTPSKELFIGALGEVAAIPFKGYKPNAARAWVEKSLEMDESIENFGGVRYQIFSYGPSMKRMFIGKPR